MARRPMNLLFIMSDAHNSEMLGCSGHPVVKTPNLDGLAAAGVRFSSAYCNCPICVPSRASLATGRYPHTIASWDNAFPYTGTFPSWGHRLLEAGRKVTTIGKLHYRNQRDDTGFPDQRNVMHVVKETGDIFALIREDMPVRPGPRKIILEAGSGETSYTRYDRATADEAIRFLNSETGDSDRLWALFVSFVTPHFPLIAPNEFLEMYPPDEVVFPKQYSLRERPMHPVIEEFRRIKNESDEFDEPTVRKAVAAYYALCSFMDHQVGRVLGALHEAGLDDTTRILYTTDHGDTMGDHALWSRSTMYQGNVGVPLILAGPDLTRGTTVDDPVSLVDCFPTILEASGVELKKEDASLPGTSLFPLATGEVELNRPIFSEYHAIGALTAIFMVRHGRYKYIHYVGSEPQLFDVVADPDELEDLAQRSDFAGARAECERVLRTFVNPEEVDKRARSDQSAKIMEHGGREAVLANHSHVVYTPISQEDRADS